MRARTLACVVLAILVVPGCAALDDDSMRLPCRNPNPPDADCSYSIGGLMAVARFNETYELARVLEGVEETGYVVRISNPNAVVADRGADERLSVEAREGWFWFTLQLDWPEHIDGLTLEEADAEAARRCAEGPAARMERALGAFESRTNWTRDAWESCRGNVAVA